jgi:pre-mRNA branch site protein p14
VSKIVLVKQLPFKITPEDMYELFGRYGPIRQIRMGTTESTRGKAFVIYQDAYDSQQAVEHLNGYNVGGRYLVLTYFKPRPRTTAAAPAINRTELEELKSRFGVTGTTQQ